MRKAINQFNTFIRSETGATSVEYAILASLIAAVIVGAVLLVGQKTLGLFTTANVGW